MSQKIPFSRNTKTLCMRKQYRYRSLVLFFSISSLPLLWVFFTKAKGSLFSSFRVKFVLNSHKNVSCVTFNKAFSSVYLYSRDIYRVPEVFVIRKLPILFRLVRTFLIDDDDATTKN